MTDDLVKRLRTVKISWDYDAAFLCEEAADEIERLRVALEAISKGTCICSRAEEARVALSNKEKEV